MSCDTVVVLGVQVVFINVVVVVVIMMVAVVSVVALSVAFAAVVMLLFPRNSSLYWAIFLTISATCVTSNQCHLGRSNEGACTQ